MTLAEGNAVRPLSYCDAALQQEGPNLIDDARALTD
jgi:hypothetical protein